MDCIADKTESYCIYCGRKKSEKIVGWPKRNCQASLGHAQAVEKLGWSWTDAKHYAGALAKWTAAGMPMRDQAEVERIEREICKPCEKYVEGRCKTCGCRVNKSSIAVANKIKMVTEKCPMGKW